MSRSSEARQNAANDELCSENSQLQVEVQRLAAEDTELPEAHLEVLSCRGTRLFNAFQEEDGWLEELIQSLCTVARLGGKKSRLNEA